MRVVLLDSGYEYFDPLSLTRPTFEMSMGLGSLREEILKLVDPSDVILVTRPHLIEYLKDRSNLKVFPSLGEVLDEGPVLLLDGRGRGVKKVLEIADNWDRDILIVDSKGRPLGIYLARGLRDVDVPDLSSILPALRERGREVKREPCEGAELIVSPWDLLPRLDEVMNHVHQPPLMSDVEGDVETGAVILGERILIEKGAYVEAGARLDARSGWILIEKGAYVEAGARLDGPVHVGEGSVIYSCSRVSSSYIGPVCRVGGEVEGTVIEGYTNKHHHGFIGHSYLGEWVNLGAGTTNSDLKNTYGTVRVWLGGRRVDTGRMKYGVLIGDMVKTAIGTMIYAGRKIGVSSHVYGTVRRDVPSFTIWREGGTNEELSLEKALEIQERMMKRRGMELSRSLRSLIERVFHLTKGERESLG